LNIQNTNNDIVYNKNRYKEVTKKMPCSKCKETGHNMRTCSLKIPKLPIINPRRNPCKIKWDEALKNEQTRKIKSQNKQIKRQSNRLNMYKEKTKEQNKKIKELEKLLKSIEEEKKEKKESAETCAVCREECENSDKHKTECGHVFHLGCLMPWMKNNNTCPCCREELYKNTTNNLSVEEIQNIATGAISFNLNISPLDSMTTNIMLPHGTLFNLGDEIGRQVLEALTDEEMGWEPMTESYASDEESSDEESKHGVEDEVTDEVTDYEDIWETPLIVEESMILTPETDAFTYERVLRLFHVNEGLSFMDIEYGIFRNHFHVMREMRSRNSFRNAWFQINNEGVRV